MSQDTQGQEPNSYDWKWPLLSPANLHSLEMTCSRGGSGQNLPSTESADTYPGYQPTT